MRQLILVNLLFSILLLSCNKVTTVYLSDLKTGFVANEFGPPNKDMTFDKKPLTIHGTVYEKGLGVHAPSEICLDLNKVAVHFKASIGLDDEVKLRTSDVEPDQLDAAANYLYDSSLDLTDYQQGATVRFKVFGDDELLYSSGWMSEVSKAIEIDVDIKSVSKLCLVVEKGEDGSYADHADWANASIDIKDPESKDKIKLVYQPSEILLNHTGFLPNSTKTFRMAQTIKNESAFSIMDASTNEVALSGLLTEKSGDWGTMLIGDFTGLQTPGDYYVMCHDQVSPLFSINRMQYFRNLEKHLTWFLWQRCGDPENGWERGQHQDDGVRLDNGEHQDVSGGWHDAADLRKWGMTINGLWALSEIYLTVTSNDAIEFEGKEALLAKLKDEIAWGNKHYFAMQEPSGYLMNQIGGDVYNHGDNNRFTDNINGTEDDRWIVTTPNAPVFQYMFVQAMCNIMLAEDQTGSNDYLSRAEKCYQWAAKNKIVKTIHEVGAALTASLKLYEVTGNDVYYNETIYYLEMILASQDLMHQPVNGFFREIDLKQDPPTYGSYPNKQLSYLLITPDFPIWSIVESIRVVEDEKLKNRAKDAFTRYFDHYIQYFDQKSSYGIIPMALYTENPGGDRKAGNYYYRWCYVNRENKDWWNGINPRIGYAGAALVRGGMLTDNPEAIRIGQQQLDFIYGCNPFNSSTVTGLGYNQPDYFKTHTFVPYTPQILGAVMAGIGSSEEDLPVLLPGWWQTTEYWMEAVCGNIMLLNELNQYEFSNSSK